MHLKLITPPSGEPLTLAEARAHLRLDVSGSPPSSPDDALLTTLITLARQNFDGRDGWIGRALMTQTYDLLLDGFPGNHMFDYLYRGQPHFRMGRHRREEAISIPLPPLQSVASIKYVDTNGVLQTMDTGGLRCL